MALPARGRRGIQDSTHNMAAARPKLAVVPSGADRAWGTADAMLSASSSFLDLRSSTVGPSASAAGQGSVAAAKGKAPAVPQPNVKKMRRRVALLSGVHLNLPTSPVVGPSPPGSSREMAWTFTAEWDSTQDEIIFSEVESGSASVSSSASMPNLRVIASPIPSDVGEDEIFDIDVSSAPPATTSPPQFSDMLASSTPSPSPSSASSPASPAVSDIFDFYTHTPSNLSFSHRHTRNGSVSTAPSSPGPSSPVDQSLSSHADGRHDPPIISVTRCQEPDDPARGMPASKSVPGGDQSGPTRSLSDGSFPEWAPLRIADKRRALPPAPNPSRVARRPLPPVPVRMASMAVSASTPDSERRSGWDDRLTGTVSSSRGPRSARTAPPSAYSPPEPGPVHVRAASLGHVQAGRIVEDAPKRVGLRKHFRSISAALAGGLHRPHHH